MKKITKIAGLFIIGLTVITTSCKKEIKTSPAEEEITTNPTTTFSNANVQSLFNTLSTPLETYIVNSSNLNSYMCVNGTRIVIYPNAFLTLAGAPVVGNINVQVKEVLSKKDMILNNAMPVSNGNLLVSGGEVYFNATQNGQKLKINPASAVYFNVPAGNNPSTQMLEYYADGSANLSNSNLNWATNSNTIAVVQDSSNLFCYDLHCDSLKWSNCDYLYNIPGTKTTCTVNLAGTFGNSNTAVFLSLNNVNTMVKLTSSYTGFSQEFTSYVNSIPVGSNYTVIAISFDGTKYYYGSQTLTMVADMVINLPALSLSSKPQIEANLSSLP